MVGHTETKIVDKDGGEGVYTKIESALSALYDVGGVVYVEKGEYTITSPLIVDSNVSLIGRGNVQIVNDTADQPTITNRNETDGNSGIYISGLNLRSTSGVNSHLIDLRKVDGSVLEDLDIDGTAKIRDQAGIRIWQGANNRVSRCRIRKVGFGVLLSNPWDGPYLCKGNIIEGCDIHHVYVGIYLLNRCDKGILRANHCHETEPEDASYVGKDGILIESCSHVLVEGNICDNNEEHGIYLAVSSSADVGSEHVCIVGNILYNNKQVGIHLNGQASMKIRKCTVTGNVCAFSQQARGIELDSYCEGNTVTGNAVFRNSLFGILETPGQNDYNAIVASASTQNGSAEGDQISKAGTNSFEEDNIKIYLWT